MDFRLNMKQALHFPKGVSNLAFYILIFCCCLLLSLNTAAQTLLPAGSVEFTDITHAAGINFIHNTGAFGEKYLPETMGSGCAFIDYDTDGWQDILLVNGKDWGGETNWEAANDGTLPQQPRRHLHRCHRNRRPRYTALRHGCSCRRLRQ